MSLVDRVKGLTKPSDEIDALIRCHFLAPEDAYVEQSPINGAWCIYRGEWQGRPKLLERPHNVPNDLWRGSYSASIDAVVALVERVLPGWVWDVSSTGSAWMMRDDDANNTHVTASGAPNPAIALILALLQTKLNKEDR